MSLRSETDFQILRTQVKLLEDRMDSLEKRLLAKNQKQDDIADLHETSIALLRGSLDGLRGHVAAMDKALEKKGIWDIGEPRVDDGKTG